MRLSCNDARNSCRSRIEFHFCDAARKKLHRVTPPKNPVVRKVARKVAPCVRDLRSDYTEEQKKTSVVGAGYAQTPCLSSDGRVIGDDVKPLAMSPTPSYT